VHNLHPHDDPAIRISEWQLAWSYPQAMSVFALRDINLTKIESRPMRSTPILYELDNGRRSYNYVFFIDLIGSTAEARAPPASCESQLWCVPCKCGR